MEHQTLGRQVIRPTEPAYYIVDCRILNELENKWRRTFSFISWVAFCLDLSLDNTKRIKHYIMLPSFTIKRSVPIFFFKLHYGTINCKIVHNISPCNHLDTLICALKWKNLEFVKNPQPSLGCFETKITRASCVRAALQRLNHTCSRTILKGYIIGGNPFWNRNLISMGIHFKECIFGSCVHGKIPVKFQIYTSSSSKHSWQAAVGFIGEWAQCRFPDQHRQTKVRKIF